MWCYYNYWYSSLWPHKKPNFLNYAVFIYLFIMKYIVQGSLANGLRSQRLLKLPTSAGILIACKLYNIAESLKLSSLAMTSLSPAVSHRLQPSLGLRPCVTMAITMGTPPAKPY